MAEQARGESEKLVVYLLDDFYLELAPVGRLDIVGDLAKRAIAYYDALPAALRTPQTERNRALALVRYGAVLRTQGKLDEGRQGRSTRRSACWARCAQRATVGGDGDRSRARAEHAGAARFERRRRRRGAADQRRGRSRPSGRWRPRPNASVAARRAYGEVLNMNGFLSAQPAANPRSSRSTKARRVQRSIDNLADDRPGVGRGAMPRRRPGRCRPMPQSDRGEDVKRAGKEAVAVAAQVLEKRPGPHAGAARAGADHVAAGRTAC